ncbi:MAG TPA: DinB family protein [Pyrinomonadaceae bacterium]|nr:DinB family protein [Pyrinomonadaceae bacterium]
MNAELASEIDRLVNRADAIGRDARKVFGALTKEQLNWKPSAERWSVAQCFDHLMTTNSGYLPIIDDILKGQKQSSVWQKLPFLPSLWGKMLIKSLDPSQTRKMKAPKRFEPSQSDVNGSIINDFASQQQLLIEKIKATSNLELERIVITSPAASFISYSLMDAYRIIVVHERRHFQQAQRVTEESEFPTAP